MKVTAMDATNTINDSPAAPAVTVTATSPRTSSADPPPPLPFELIESILLHVPLRFPLRNIVDYSAQDSEQMHNDSAAALVAIPLPTSAYKVFLPRMSDGFRKMMMRVERFSVEYLHRLFQSGFRFCIGAAFSAAVEHNRVDVLEWWVGAAKLKVPKFDDYHDWDDSPIRLAVQAEAWDALDWLACGSYHKLCDDGLTDEELADLVRTRGKRQVQLVSLWLTAGFEVLEYVKGVIEAACEMGCVDVLQGWVDGHRVWFEPDTKDEMCGRAVNGRGPVMPVLEWMHKNEWAMPNLPCYASEAGNVEILMWWKEKKAQIDAQVRDAYLDGESDSDGELEFLPSHGVCLDQLGEKGHQHVIDWWMQNLDLLPIPNLVEQVDAASGDGDLEFLKVWNQQRGLSNRRYDCNEALCQAIMSGQLAVLEWWFKESNVRLKFDIDEMIRTAFDSEDHWKEMVCWWINKSGVAVALEDFADIVVQCDDVDMLDRWDELDRFIPVDEIGAIMDAAKRNDTDILDWWASDGSAAFDQLVRSGNTQLVDAASSAGSSHTLEWIRNYCAERGIEFCYTEKALDGLVWNSHVTCQVSLVVMQWWCESGLELKYTESALKNAVLWLLDEDVKWWLEQSLPIRYTKECLAATVQDCGPWIGEFVQSHGTVVSDDTEQGAKLGGSFHQQQ